jgi:hypothetical protein
MLPTVTQPASSIHKVEKKYGWSIIYTYIFGKCTDDRRWPRKTTLAESSSADTSAFRRMRSYGWTSDESCIPSCKMRPHPIRCAIMGFFLVPHRSQTPTVGSLSSASRPPPLLLLPSAASSPILLRQEGVGASITASVPPPPPPSRLRLVSIHPADPHLAGTSAPGADVEVLLGAEAEK